MERRETSARRALQVMLVAALLLELVVVLVVGPLVGLSAFIVTETVGAVQSISGTVLSQGANGLLEKLPDSLERLVHRLFDRVQIDTGALASSIQDQLTSARGSAAAALGAAVSATGSLLFQGVMMLLCLPSSCASASPSS